MGNPLHKIKKTDFDHFQLDAAMILNKFDVTGVEPVVDEDIICMTTGDVSISVTPTIVDQGEDVNGCPPNLADLQDIQGWAVKASFTALTSSPAVLAMSLGAADVGSPEHSDHVTVRAKFDVSKDFHDTWIVGKKMGGGILACCIKKAVSSAGLSMTTTKNGKGQLAVELTGHPSIDDADPEVPPVEFYSTDTYTGGPAA